jgi:ribosomal protein L13E
LSSKTKKPDAKPVDASGTVIPHVRAKVKAPVAMVSSRNGTEMVSRQGRGFSLGEVSGAGLDPRSVANGGAHIDVRRRSVIEGNVESLKGWGAHLHSAEKPVGRVKKVEVEVEKVAKEIEVEAVRAEKEVVKVEKAARKEAVKAEKAVKAKVAKPKAKPKPKKKKT